MVGRNGMVTTPPRIVAHVDMDAFFASVEAREHAEWKGEPIVVCVFSGRGAEGGVVSSCSYDARQLGVHAGMPIVHAKKLCPQGHFVPVRHEVYGDISEEIFTGMYSFADSIEIASIDEAYAELTYKCGTFETAENKLREFQSTVKKEFGLTCSIGLSTNKLVSKIASDFQKPNGFTCVLPENISSFLDPLPVKKLLGVGPKTEEELEKKNIHTILDIRQTPLNELIKSFGAARGQWLFYSSRGMDDSPLQPERERKQYSRIWTLVQDVSAWSDVQHLVSQHADEMWSETAEKGKYFTQIGVIGITNTLSQTSKSRTLSIPIPTREFFNQEIEGLFHQLMKNPETQWRRLGIRVSGFASPPKQKRLGDFG